ncbi:MAG: formylglycine-generating enzyme family protein [Pseudanabaena sp. LacPavin_0818_WC45_MAG_42_6]|jgi:formylglycine-generating enzyme required for sulfatase activity|nr:formylglycine-generating enzyme family protein [Pseudanabaena sp. LacPavin_0818_WC45_MAG_42_6]
MEKKLSQVFSEYLGVDNFLELVHIPEGKFVMGTAHNEEGYASERPSQLVKVSSFYLGKFPITQRQWQAVAKLPEISIPLNPDSSHFKNEVAPVENISWVDAIEFCDRLSKLTGRNYRLPSEAEWEYACLGGKSTRYYFGDKISSDFANYDGRFQYESEASVKYRDKTTPVGTFSPNNFGLYDMHGNVWEWCADPWHKDYRGRPTNASVWDLGGDPQYRVLRGGSWNHDAWECRATNRRKDPFVNWYNYYGFRIALSK